MEKNIYIININCLSLTLKIIFKNSDPVSKIKIRRYKYLLKNNLKIQNRNKNQKKTRAI